MTARLALWFGSGRSASVALLALVVLLGVGGYFFTRAAVRHDRDVAAVRRAEVEAVRAQEVLGRARAYIEGLANLLAGERTRGQREFARLAGGTSASVGLDDVLWVQRVPRSERGRYERLRGSPITRLTSSGRFERAPAAATYLPATFTSLTRPELRPGVDVTGFPGLAEAIYDRARIFAVSASRPGSLGPEPGFYLLEASSFAGGRDNSGYLAAFVPRGWFTTTLGGDPRQLAISEDRRRIDGDLASVQARASFDTLGRRWRIDVGRDPPSGLQSALPWLALGWPFAAAVIALLVGRAITLRRRAQRDVERVFELSLDLLAIVRFDGRYMAANPAFERTLGYARHEMLAGTYLDFVHPDDLEATRQAFADVIGGKAIAQFENRHICADGSIRWLEWSARAVPEQAVIYATARDVTDRRRTDAELREARLTAEARGAELQTLAEEQAALRRVATLIAREASQAEIFNSIAEEIGQLLGTDEIRMLRNDDERSALVVASWGAGEHAFPVGSRHSTEGDSVASWVLRTARTARIDDYEKVHGPVAETVSAIGIRSSVGAPILVEGQLWGVMTTGTTADQPLPPDTESRLTQFTELMATAIANTESHALADRLAEEQAALRRVATLVAQGVQPAEIFSAVSREVGRLFGSDTAAVSRFDTDGSAHTVVGLAGCFEGVSVGSRFELDDSMASTAVYRTGRPARSDRVDWSEVSAPIGELARRLGSVCTVSSPIAVEGRLWGVISVTDEKPLPLDAEERLEKFTELVATAIANAQVREELSASRARIVTSADQARRRIERDLHDGAQQRLVTLTLELRAARAAVPAELDDLAAQLGRVAEGLEDAFNELRELARGIHPAILADGGVEPALKTLARRSAVPVSLKVRAEGRLPESLEVAAYYIVSEALTNATKHAQASVVAVDIEAASGALRIAVRDDGVGGADFAHGSGLVGLKDRVEALGGRIALQSDRGAGTSLSVELPLPSGGDPGGAPATSGRPAARAGRT